MQPSRWTPANEPQQQEMTELIPPSPFILDIDSWLAVGQKIAMNC